LAARVQLEPEDEVAIPGGRAIGLDRASRCALLIIVVKSGVVEYPLDRVLASGTGHAVRFDRVRRADADDVSLPVGSGGEQYVLDQRRCRGGLDAQKH